VVPSERDFLGAEVWTMMTLKFENEGQKFRAFMSENPDAVVVQRNADGSCEVEIESEGALIDLQPSDYTVVE
jgi:hypothetical protein